MFLNKTPEKYIRSVEERMVILSKHFEHAYFQLCRMFNGLMPSEQGKWTAMTPNETQFLALPFHIPYSNLWGDTTFSIGV